MADLFDYVAPDRYPEMPGYKGGDTSREAAEAMAPKCGRLQRLTLDVIASRGARGATADEAAEALGYDRWSIQPRTSELRNKRLIADSGLRRENATGKRAIVWTLPQYKREGGGNAQA